MVFAGASDAECRRFVSGDVIKIADAGVGRGGEIGSRDGSPDIIIVKQDTNGMRRDGIVGIIRQSGIDGERHGVVFVPKYAGVVHAGDGDGLVLIPVVGIEGQKSCIKGGLLIGAVAHSQDDSRGRLGGEADPDHTAAAVFVDHQMIGRDKHIGKVPDLGIGGPVGLADIIPVALDPSKRIRPKISAQFTVGFDDSRGLGTVIGDYPSDLLRKSLPCDRAIAIGIGLFRESECDLRPVCGSKKDRTRPKGPGGVSTVLKSRTP